MAENAIPVEKSVDNPVGKRSNWQRLAANEPEEGAVFALITTVGMALRTGPRTGPIDPDRDTFLSMPECVALLAAMVAGFGEPRGIGPFLALAPHNTDPRCPGHLDTFANGKKSCHWHSVGNCCEPVTT